MVTMILLTSMFSPCFANVVNSYSFAHSLAVLSVLIKHNDMCSGRCIHPVLCMHALRIRTLAKFVIITVAKFIICCNVLMDGLGMGVVLCSPMLAIIH